MPNFVLNLRNMRNGNCIWLEPNRSFIEFKSTYTCYIESNINK